MVNYIEAKISCVRAAENGLQKKVNETYLVIADTLAQAESKLLAYCANYGKDVTIQRMQVVKYSEVLSEEDADRWYKFRVAFITLDEKSGKEKKTTVSILVSGTDDENARRRYKEAMQASVTDWQVVSISESPILDIIR